MALIRYFSQTLDANLDRTLIPGPDSRNRLKEPTMRANDILPDQQNSLDLNRADTDREAGHASE